MGIQPVPYLDGYTAGQEGRSIESCPYGVGTYAEKVWQKGFRQASAKGRRKIRYSVLGEGDTCYISDVEVEWSSEVDWVCAQECAKNYHYRHDGWENSSWPLTFVLSSVEGEELGRFEVSRECVPEFSATRIKSRDQDAPSEKRD